MKFNQYVIYIGALLAFLPFQNCSKPFSVNELASQVGVFSAPNIVLTTTVAPLSNQRNMTINYITTTDSRAGTAAVTCTLNAAPRACSASAVNLSNLADGDYVLAVEARDNRGQAANPLNIRFRVDASAPAVVLSQTPAAISGVVTAVFIFAATDALSGVDRVECALDAANFAGCSSPLNLSALSAGRHMLRVRAIDLAGNLSSEQMFSWMVDLSAPIIVISQNPSAFVNNGNASVSFSGTDDGLAITNFECRLDAGSFMPCTSPVTYSGIADGNHSISVRGRDNAGNMSSPVSVNWLVDTVLPTISITQSPSATTTQTAANFSFTAMDVNSGLATQECQLNTQSFQTCAMTASYTGLSVGAHVFRIRATDRAGNQQISTYNWTVTAAAPPPPPPPPAATSIRLAWDPNTESTLAGYRIYYGTSPGNYTQNINAALPPTLSGAVSYVITGLTGGQTYYFVVRAYDAAGIESLSSNQITAAP